MNPKDIKVGKLYRVSFYHFCTPIKDEFKLFYYMDKDGENIGTMISKFINGVVCILENPYQYDQPETEKPLLKVLFVNKIIYITHNDVVERLQNEKTR